MLKYILTRLLIFIPTLVAISLLTFIISINTPGDPVDSMLNQSSNTGQSSDKLASEQAYIEQRAKLGLDKPLFYFSFTNATYSDTLYRVHKKSHRETLEKLSFKYGNWPQIANYYSLIKKFENKLFLLTVSEDLAEDFRKLKEFTNSLYTTADEKTASTIISNIDFIVNGDREFIPVRPNFTALQKAIISIVQNQSPHQHYIPKFIWYGLDNQYHNWIFGDEPWFGQKESGKIYMGKGFLRGDFGTSYKDKRPVSSVLWDALQWTVLLSTLSIILAYIVAIPLGIKTAVDKGSKTEKSITATLFMLYSLPNFWIATLLIIFLCGGDYLDLFPPAFSLGKLPESAPFWDRFIDTSHRLILPVFCLTYASFAFISRQMRGGMLNVIEQDFIRTARAKGLKENTVIWKHALRNSLIPIITLFANVFPLAISGSFVIEFIFSIPGVGKLTLEALTARNYPIVYTVLMFTAILTLIGNLVADLLYAFVDPRISFSSGKK